MAHDFHVTPCCPGQDHRSATSLASVPATQGNDRAAPASPAHPQGAARHERDDTHARRNGVSWPYIVRMIDVPVDIPPGLGNFKPVSGKPPAGRDHQLGPGTASAQPPWHHAGKHARPQPGQASPVPGTGKATKAAIAVPAKIHIKTAATVPGRVAKMRRSPRPKSPRAMRRSLFTFQEGTTAMPVVAGYVADRLFAGWSGSSPDGGKPAVWSLNRSSAAGRTFRGSAISAASLAMACRRCRLTTNRSTSMRR